MQDELNIETDRLVLRPMELSDENDLLEYQSDLQTVTYIPWPARTREQVREAMSKAIAATSFENENDYKLFVWVLKDGGKVIGQSNISIKSKLHQRAEIGWVINPKFAGRGYALEATKAVIDLVFSELGFRRVVAYMDQRNTKSVNIAKKLGMRLEASYIEDEFFKDEWSSAHLFALLKSEWKGKNA